MVKFVFILLIGLVTGASAGFSPLLNLVGPRGGQRGTEVEITFSGERLDDVQEIIFYEPGLGISGIDAKDPNNVKAKLRIAPDARLGEYSLRLRTAGGITALKSFFVGQFPCIAEAEPNNNFDQPQKIELNTTVHGVSGNEDEDYFLCSLKKGQRLSVEVEGMRLGRTMFDTYVAVLDPRRFEIGASDDAPLLRTDSFVSVIAPEDGDYRVVVREAAYEGTDACQYRLHIGTFPRPKAIFPLGGKPGETVDFMFTGDPSGPIKRSVTLPSGEVSRLAIFPEHEGFSAPSPHWIHVSILEHSEESGPNQEQKFASAMPPIPSAAHGILDAGQKMDWFKFSAKKDENLAIHVIARGLRSPLDPVLSIFNAEAKRLAENDDQGGPDSKLAWTCPADGEYFLNLSDQLGRGGIDFTYRIEVERKSQALTASLPTVERNDTQKWKMFPVPRGNRYAAVVNVARENVACDVLFEAASLPPGVTMQRPLIPKALTTFPVILEAAADAPIAGALSTFTIKSAGEKVPVLEARLLDTISHVEINNQGSYHAVTVDRIPTAVIAEAPFKLNVEAPPVPIVKDGVLALKLTATRSAGYAEPITVRFLWSPPGISGPVTMDIPGDKSEISYELNANADAASGEWPICFLAEAKTPQGPILVSSGFVTLKVGEPYLAVALDLAATEQGRDISISGKINKQQDFEGSAIAELTGLPNGVTARPQSFAKDQAEISFLLEVAAEAVIGKHTAIFCKVSVPQAGTMILHQTAKNSTLRIDKPPPAPVATTDAPAAQKPQAATGEKPLSRLEQLRQKAQ